MDDLRFDIVDSLSRAKFYALSSYNKESLEKKAKGNPPRWMENQIQKDLQGIRHANASSDALDTYLKQFSKETLEKDYLLIRFTLKEDKFETYPKTLSRFGGRLEAVKNALHALKDAGLLPEKLDFILCINDKIFDAYEGEVPIFVFSKNVEDPRQKNLILMPDGMNLSRWAYIYPTIRFASFIFPWSKKTDRMIWRGSNTNPVREKLVSKKEAYPFLDASLTDGRGGTYIIPEYQIENKYLLSLDGISSTWPGLLWKLASNGLVLKQKSSHMQWYYGAMEPGVHYLEVKGDLSDLREKYDWAQGHQTESQRISDQAQRFVQENLLYEDMLHYMARVFGAYHRRTES